jgi:arylsulfatase A-like enzyme
MLDRILTAVALIASSLAVHAQQAGRPNIIFIVTDDHGFNDIESQDMFNEVKMPNLHDLDRNGVRFTRAYVTAPVCAPSRAGILSGSYQQRFGLNGNPDTPMPYEVLTIPDRLQSAGYVTGMVGKWHLQVHQTSLGWLAANGYASLNDVPADVMTRTRPFGQGFDEYSHGNFDVYRANFDITGQSFPHGVVDYATCHNGAYSNLFRIELQTRMAKAFINRRAGGTDPFFLYLAYFGPHTPLDGIPTEYLDRHPTSFPNSNPQFPDNRRKGLALLSAIDDGVGQIKELLASNGMLENTIIFFIGDNGGPPQNNQTTWDGSVNDPFIGYKNHLLEGGQRVPFVAYWKGQFDRRVISDSVSSLDLGATAVALAGLPHDAALDGVNLMPRMTGQSVEPPHDYLYSRFNNLGAVSHEQWKYIADSSGNSALFDLSTHQHELVDLKFGHPAVVTELARRLDDWLAELSPPGLLVGAPGAPLSSLLASFGSAQATGAWNFCVSNGATIGSTGSISVAADDFVLTADGMSNEPCLFVLGLEPNSVPTPFSFGWQCLGNTCRMNPPLVPMGGSVSRPTPIADYAPMGYVTPTPGTTMYYQCFYRSNGAFDTTDGLVVTFDN